MTGMQWVTVGSSLLAQGTKCVFSVPQTSFVSGVESFLNLRIRRAECPISARKLILTGYGMRIRV